MQDRYAGDIGDYVKLALLRAIAPDHQLGILWYLYPDETHNGDGRHTTYLDSPGRWRHLDPALFDALQQVLPVRTVTSIERSATLDAHFFGESVDSGQIAPGERDEWREEWFARAINFLAECSVVFADPDNGLVCDDPENVDKRSLESRFRWGKLWPSPKTEPRSFITTIPDTPEAMTWK